MGTQGYTHLIGKLRVAPYMNQLAGQCGLATRYTTITHPAIANDVGVLAGDPHGLVHNSCGTACTTTAPSLLSQVPSWRAFIGGMPGACRKLERGGRRVLAALQPADVRDAVPAVARSICRWGRPKQGPLQRAIAQNALPAFTLIVPDGCHDTGFDKHCGGQAEAGGVRRPGDLWLRSWMRALTISPAYQSGSTVIFVTWNQGAPAKPLGAGCTARALPEAPATCRCWSISPYVKAGRANVRPASATTAC